MPVYSKKQKLNLNVRKYVPIAVLFICLFVLILSAKKVSASDGLHSFLKTAPPLVEPNVLFFVDSSGSMLWPMDAPADELNPYTCTFGDGSLGWQQNHSHIQEYYGRDLDNTNNDPENSDHYHPLLIRKPNGELMPNDSRAYKLKLVLWRVLNDKEFVSGIRLAFATYAQTFIGNKFSYKGYQADWYRYPHKKFLLSSANNGSPGHISGISRFKREFTEDGGGYFDPLPSTTPKEYRNSWMVSSGVIIGENNNMRRAVLRSDFRSYINSADGSINEPLLNTKILRWIDGKEEYTSNSQCTPSNYYKEGENPEIRFDGWRPLAESIFFRDGNETKTTLPNSAANAEGLREGSIDQLFTLSRSNSPLFITDYCQDQWLVLMTAGGQYPNYTNPSSRNPVEAVQKLYNTKIKISGNDTRPIRTVVLGFVDPTSTDPVVVALRKQLNDMADMGDDGTLNGSATAYFATDVPAIMEAMRKILATIRAGSGTHNAPLLSPSRSDSAEDVFFKTSYESRADAHWKGDLKKYAADGKDTVLWSAADILNDKDTAWKERIVYVPALTGLTSEKTNLARFSTDNAVQLGSIMGIEQNQANPFASNFIQWYLGDDIYEEIGGRFKLFDIHLSGFARVGPPDARIAGSAYREFMFLHRDRPELIFTQSNAGLLHAFNVADGKERWALIPPNALVKGRLRGIKGDWVGSTWRYDTSKKSYSRYITDGPLVVHDAFFKGQYRTVLLALLGFGGAGMYAVDITSANAPRFLWAVENDLYQAKDEKLRQKSDQRIRVWSENGSTVSEDVYPIDDQLSSAWNYQNLRFTLSTPFIGFVSINSPENPVLQVNEWVFVMGNGTPRDESSFNTGQIYISKIENGQIIKALSPPVGSNASFFVSPVAVLFEGVRRQIKTFFVADSKAGIIYMGDLSSSEIENWELKELFSISSLKQVGTGDVGVSYSMEISKFENDYWLFVGTGDWLNFGTGDSSSTNYFLALNLKNLQPPIPTPSKLDNQNPIALNNNGWFIEFAKGELLSTPPFIYNGYIFFSTFSKGSDPCNPNDGTARLYTLKGINGEGAWDGEKFKEFPHQRIGGIAIHRNTVFIASTSFDGTDPVGKEPLPEGIENNEYSNPAGLPGSKKMNPLYWKGR